VFGAAQLPQPADCQLEVDTCTSESAGAPMPAESPNELKLEEGIMYISSDEEDGAPL
jgi:hypothetical protein